MPKSAPAALVDVITREAMAAGTRVGISPRAARDMAGSILEGVGRELGGANCYIPRKPIDREARAAEIRSLFDGGNYEALAKRFDMSAGHIRRIVKDSDVARTKRTGLYL